MNKHTLSVALIDSTDPSVQCIHAIRQVMDTFNGKLSANGKDKRAVYAWFVERYNPKPELYINTDPKK